MELRISPQARGVPGKVKTMVSGTLRKILWDISLQF